MPELPVEAVGRVTRALETLLNISYPEPSSIEESLNQIDKAIEAVEEVIDFLDKNWDEIEAAGYEDLKDIYNDFKKVLSNLEKLRDYIDEMSGLASKAESTLEDISSIISDYL